MRRRRGIEWMRPTGISASRKDCASATLTVFHERLPFRPRRMSHLIRNIRYPLPKCHCVSADSHYRMEFIVALLEQDLEVPPGAAPWLTPWQHQAQRPCSKVFWYSALQQSAHGAARLRKKAMDKIWWPLISNNSEIESVRSGGGYHASRRQGQLGAVV